MLHQIQARQSTTYQRTQYELCVDVDPTHVNWMFQIVSELLFCFYFYHTTCSTPSLTVAHHIVSLLILVSDRKTSLVL